MTPPKFENNVNNVLTNSHVGINNSFYLFDPVLTGQKRYRDDFYNLSPNFSGGLKPITPIGTTPLNISGYFMFNNVNSNNNINVDTPIDDTMKLGTTPGVNNIGFYTWVMNGTPVLKNKKNLKLKKTSYQNDSS